jgi:hypothetical protein
VTNNNLMREWHLRLKAGIGVVAPKLLAKDFESEISSAVGGRDPPYSWGSHVRKCLYVEAHRKQHCWQHCVFRYCFLY